MKETEMKQDAMDDDAVPDVEGQFASTIDCTLLSTVDTSCFSIHDPFTLSVFVRF
jgi:hypothetical protein